MKVGVIRLSFLSSLEGQKEGQSGSTKRLFMFVVQSKAQSITRVLRGERYITLQGSYN